MRALVHQRAVRLGVPVARGVPSACLARRGRGRHPQLAVQAVFSSTTTNPAFTFAPGLDGALSQSRRSRGENQIMSFDGTVNKAALCVVLSAMSAAATWAQIFSGSGATAMAALGAAKVCGIVGLVSAFASMFKPQWAPVTAPVYALAKGVALAGMSAVLEMQYPGIAMNAVMLTLSTAMSMFFAVRTRLIRITDRFADTVRAVTGGYFIALLLVFVGGMVGLKLPALLSGGPLAIAIPLMASGLAAANLLLDLNFIEQCSFQRMPKFFEWYGAQSLCMTLVWMYTEVLRLLWAFAGMGRGE